jgi:subtilisin family serine protease
MARPFFFLALLTLAIAPSVTAAGPTYEPGELLVAYDEEGSVGLGPNQNLAPRRLEIAQVLSQHGLERYVRITPSRGLTRSGSVQFAKLISSRQGFDPVQAARELRATGAFRAVSPNYHAELHVTLPDDFLMLFQWHVDSAGDEDIKLPEAWDIERGDSSVVIAIMDTGVDIEHPDLMNRIWTNWAEIPGNDTDDDGNGYVDDIHGWDFGNGDNDPMPHALINSQGIDVGFHGTHMAGIASAETNNSIGVAGTCWDSRIMPLKILDSLGVLTLESITSAFEYATDEGADVLSMSFGIPAGTDPGEVDPAYMQTLVDNATAAGVVCVASAGNDSTDVAPLPAGNDDVLAVGATDQTNSRLFFSNFGSWVDVCSPGTAIYSTICRNYEFDLNSTLAYILFWAWNQIDPYMYGDGTSMSTPQVSGVAALIRSRWPSLTSQQVAQRILSTGDVISTDLPIGVKLNAYQAVMGDLVGAPGPSGLALRFESVAPNPFASSTTLRFAVPAEGHVSLALFDVQGRRVRQLVGETVPAGLHAAHWDGRGEDGRRLTSGIYFAKLESAGLAATRRIVLFN